MGWRNSKAGTMVVTVVRLICGVGLILATSVWIILLARLVAGLVTGGANGARGTLHQMMLAGSLRAQLDHDPILALSQGYERLVILLLVTWALREMLAFANRKARF